eukprot:5077852-Pyramimonas_sp.AAC.1
MAKAASIITCIRHLVALVFLLLMSQVATFAAISSSESTTTAACVNEQRILQAEADFRQNKTMIWFQHIQRSGGYIMCSYARANNLWDWGSSVGCAECPCGYGPDDKILQRLSPAQAKLFLATHKGHSNKLQISRKDKAAPAQSGSTKHVNFIEVEYHSFSHHPPAVSEFVYVTLLRDPVERTLSWIS